MMEAVLGIGTVERRYRLPAAELGARRRLDALTEALMREHLSAILARLGFGADDILCIRELRLDLPWRPGMPDAACLEDWTARLSSTLAEAIARADAGTVVRYGSRVEAFAEAGRALAAGRLERAWAWASLGITVADHRASPRQLAREWLAAMTEAPEMPAAMRLLARSGTIAELLGHGLLRHADLAALARALLERDGRTAALEAPRGRTPGTDAEVAPPSGNKMHVQEEYKARIWRVVNLSRLPSSMLRGSDEDEARALAVWPLLEVEPAALSLPPADLRTLLDAVAAGLPAGGRPSPVPPIGERAPQHAPASVKPPQGLPSGYAASSEREAVDRAPRPEAPEMAPGRGQRAAAAPVPPERAAAAPVPPERAGEEENAPAARKGDTSADAAIASMPPAIRAKPTEPEKTLRSDFGGLLFWLNAMRRFGTVRGLLSEAALAERPAGWTFEAFATAALELPLDDPALAVFADRAPDAAPWQETEAPATPDERNALSAHVAHFAAALGRLLPERAAEGLLEAVARRPARIAVRSGWIAATLPLETVETDLRRAGLDLHPDHVPWLGCVVRIDYGEGP